jgi:rRNA pseudouridine-1189 N-methylase Emg1 (Nep1/Mra1 family)
MAIRSEQKVKTIPMTIGNDPALFRFASLQDALASSSHLLAALIYAGQRELEAANSSNTSREDLHMSESA